mgnify:CR=1 FL=1
MDAIGNTVLQLLESPENYVELLAYANNVIRQQTPKKKIVIAAILEYDPDPFFVHDESRHHC